MIIALVELDGSQDPEASTTDPVDLVQRRLMRRRAAYRQAASDHGFGEITWACPTCGAVDHGIPNVAGASVSTSSHGDWAVIAFGPVDTRMGIDMTSRTAPPEAEAIASTHFTPGEQTSRPATGWNTGSAFARVWAAKEALGKAAGVGIAVDRPGKARGVLDSYAHAAYLVPWPGSSLLPAHLVGAIALFTGGLAETPTG